MKRLLAVGALVAALVGCGRPVGPARGLVVAKEYDDPDEWTTQICTYRDAKTSVCYVWSTQHHRDGPHWWVELRDSTGRRGWREVPRAVYELCSMREPCDTRLR